MTKGVSVSQRHPTITPYAHGGGCPTSQSKQPSTTSAIEPGNKLLCCAAAALGVGGASKTTQKPELMEQQGKGLDRHLQNILRSDRHLRNIPRSDRHLQNITTADSNIKKSQTTESNIKINLRAE